MWMSEEGESYHRHRAPTVIYIDDQLTIKEPEPKKSTLVKEKHHVTN